MIKNRANKLHLKDFKYHLNLPAFSMEKENLHSLQKIKYLGLKTKKIWKYLALYRKENNLVQRQLKYFRHDNIAQTFVQPYAVCFSKRGQLSDKYDVTIAKGTYNFKNIFVSVYKKGDIKVSLLVPSFLK